MRIIPFFLSFFLCVLSQTNAQQPLHRFEIKEGRFWYDDQPVQIYGGEMHFARIPHEYWRHRLQMLKAMGMNTVSTYVFWNYHEVKPGVWDFKTENRNLRKFIQTAAEEGLMVILRPGPYACAEWEFGGYPWWLQNDTSLVIRSDNPAFLAATDQYIRHLIGEIKDLQITQGGPIIMVQVENEFGSYVAQRKDIPLARHRAYNAAIKEQLLRAGVETPLFTSDGSWLFEGGSVTGVLPTANGEDDVEKLKQVVDQYHEGKGPYMVAEFYPGWLDHWAEPFPKVATEWVVQQTKKYLDAGVSFNYYMAHGGSNFGFTSGANYDKDHGIQPSMTSYDYDAPISEAGWATEKYHAIRNLMAAHLPFNLPPVPAPLPVIDIPYIDMKLVGGWHDLLDNEQVVLSDQPLTFEALGQGVGYVWYRRKFETAATGTLKIEGLRDYATVYVNGERVGELNRYYNRYVVDVAIPDQGVLDILVENMGRINYGPEIIRNKKGIVGPVMIDDEKIIKNWEMYRLPLETPPKLPARARALQPGRAAIYKGNFHLKKTGDTFLDMRAWGKGIVFVNGRHIGRYWRVGPQQTLYVPGVWLKKGANEIVVFEQLNHQIPATLQAVKIPVLEELRGE